MASSYSSIGALFLMILIQFTTLPKYSCLAAKKIPATSTSEKTDTEFIKTSCATTDDPKLCLTTFSAHESKVKGNPQLLASTALTVTLNLMDSTSKSLTKLSKTKGLKPKEATALRDCVKQLKDSADETKRSIGEMASGAKTKSSFESRIGNVQTWMSAALDNQQTCVDEFSEYGNIKTTATKEISKVKTMTGMALDFVSSCSATPRS